VQVRVHDAAQAHATGEVAVIASGNKKATPRRSHFFIVEVSGIRIAAVAPIEFIESGAD
jgi:hypothetical protein